MRPNIFSQPYCSDSRHEVLAALTLNFPLHTYGICNVSSLWECSRWFIGLTVTAGIINQPGRKPFLYALDNRAKPVGELLSWLSTHYELPDEFEFGIAPTSQIGLTSNGYDIAGGRTINKMFGTTYPRSAEERTAKGCVVLEKKDLPAVTELLDSEAGVGALFSPEMLDTYAYVGKMEDGQLVAMAGVHFLDTTQRLATIGNVVTHQDYRGKGYGRIVMDLCISRLNMIKIEAVGLNVLSTNTTAFNLYESLGLELVGQQFSGVAKQSYN